MESKLHAALSDAASARGEVKAQNLLIERLQSQLDTWVNTAQQLMKVTPTSSTIATPGAKPREESPAPS